MVILLISAIFWEKPSKKKHMFIVDNRNTRNRWEISSQLTSKTTGRQWHRFDVFIVNCEHIPHLFLVLLLLNLNRQMFGGKVHKNIISIKRLLNRIFVNFQGQAKFLHICINKTKNNLEYIFLRIRKPNCSSFTNFNSSEYLPHLKQVLHSAFPLIYFLLIFKLFVLFS